MSNIQEINNLTDKINELNEELARLKRKGMYPTNNTLSTPNDKDSAIQEGFQNIDLANNYNSMTEQRKKLNDKLYELYGNDGRTIYDLDKATLDANVYANVLWTILATSMIYFIFIKL